MPVLTHEEAKGFYDRFGSRQDSQGFYENPAVEEMIAHADFHRARAVFEFGCGTGRVAARLLADYLPEDAVYLGVDVSETMVRLAARRVEPWADRATVMRSDGAMTIPGADGQFDRVYSTYVTDLLAESDIDALLAEAHRVLMRGGLFCNAGLTFGDRPWSRLVMGLWQRVHERRAEWLGGCRPLVIADRLEGPDWVLEHHVTLSRLGIASEVAVARARA